LGRGGWVGVDLFFVLSGFLVSGLLFSEHIRSGRVSPWRFYVRRGFKIYPAFYVYLVVCMAIVARKDLQVDYRKVLADALFVQNYFSGLLGHTWSLAVEEHFYLALPLLLLVLGRIPTRGTAFALLPLAVGCICVGLLGLRIWQASQSTFSFRTAVAPTHLRLDSLLFGVLVSYMWHYYPVQFKAALYPWRHCLIASSALLFLPAFLLRIQDTPFIYTTGFTLFYLGGAALTAGTLLTAVPSNAMTRFLGFLGAHSYSVYLWHLPIRNWGIPGLEELAGVRFPFLVTAVVFIGGSFGFGIVMAKLIENPALALRERVLPPRRTGDAREQLNSCCEPPAPARTLASAGASR
jgi:peptidoglycan/LPS O-acetylase OafA/YrhL